MAKIIYGVSGQGFGHSTRSREVLQYLVSKGHQVLVFTYGQALFFLDEDFDVFEVPGLGLTYKNNKLIYWQTIYQNVYQVAKQSRHWNKILEKFRSFDPDIVITDFEPLTALLAKLQRVPLISIDNQHQLTNTKIEISSQYKKDFLADKLVVKSVVWGAKYYLVTSFFETLVRRKDTFLFPPIVRREVRQLIPQDEDYILVYQNSDFKDLIKTLGLIDYKFVVFGSNRKGTAGNIEFKDYSSHEWLKYLANCKAIIGTAGLSLISEALYLKKPYLSIPIKKQTEQMINAKYLVELGYGLEMIKSNEQEIKSFIRRIPEFKSSLLKYKNKNEMAIFRKLDQIISYFT
ncbi:MAG: glycosyltransferase family protein [Candidatus Buchananbacteria bacterium]|nr:glycosyltransferase family protein [Candidatus Buchananbacteria bacterium]